MNIYLVILSWFLLGIVAVVGYIVAFVLIYKTKALCEKAKESGFLRGISRRGVEMKATREALYRIHEDGMALDVKGFIPIETIPGIGNTVDQYLTRYDDYICDLIDKDPKRAAKVLSGTTPIFLNLRSSLERSTLESIMSAIKTAITGARALGIKVEGSKPGAPAKVKPEVKPVVKE